MGEYCGGTPKFTAFDFEADINSAVSGEPLPAPSAQFKDAWVKAASDAKKGEVAFRGNYNVGDQDEPSKGPGRPCGSGLYLNFGCLALFGRFAAPPGTPSRV